MHHLFELVTGKDIHIATHWDCDGVTSGALLYHLLKPYARSITTISKGDVFLILPEDIPSSAQITICSDIQPSPALDPNTTIYIDHHPHDHVDNFLLAIHDETMQSCSLVIWRELMQQNTDPYLHFLVLLGYFGDSGKFDQLPGELQVRAKSYFSHLLQPRTSSFGNTYLPIELYVSLFNTGKRMHWSGRVPLELLKSVKDLNDIVLNRHPLVDELQRYKMELRSLYNMELSFQRAQHVDYAVIECDKNIQGVMCARYMQDRPVMVLNKFKGKIIASMRVPNHIDFDAGAFLSRFRNQVPGMLGGGHEKAGGITFGQEHLDAFITLIHEKTPEK